MQERQGLKHASNLTQAMSRDKFQPCHRQLVEYVALLASHALRCMHKAGNCAQRRVSTEGMLLLSGPSADQTMLC